MRPLTRATLAGLAATSALLAASVPATGHPTHDGSGKEAGFDRAD